ncbi:hypothetical protein MKW94_017420 [Papaver nudicaule]|uniref:CRAL/TRIO N-terminal domain-containing protein n=1 Tax=Papaver nudicaule TaxID=74823 RepID=A0AA41VQJ9_PAPNU|nr:hypothetical protein [Papaver nudicaule]
MEKNHEMEITQMRKSLEKLDLSTQNYNDATLLRFLIARSMDIEKATKMFVEWKSWRDEFVPLGFIPDSEVPDELSDEKIYLQGLSRIGQHPYSKSKSRYLNVTLVQFTVIIVSKEEHRIDFIKQIGEETLGEDYGGQGKLILVQDVAVDHFQAQTD